VAAAVAVGADGSLRLSIDLTEFTDAAKVRRDEVVQHEIRAFGDFLIQKAHREPAFSCCGSVACPIARHGNLSSVPGPSIDLNDQSCRWPCPVD